MSNNIKIKYTNKSLNPDQPTIFVFAQNETPTFDALKEGVAWTTMPNIGMGSSSTFEFPIEVEVQAMWGRSNETRLLTAELGKRYSVIQDPSGIILEPDGDALDSKSIEINNRVEVDKGIQARLLKDGKVMMVKRIVAHDQKATFVLKPKLYFGVASEIQEGDLLNSAVLNSDRFWELDLEGITEAEVILEGNPKVGYEFRKTSVK